MAKTVRTLLGPVLTFIHHYLGWRNWSVLVYNSFIENLFILFYVALREELYSARFTLDFFVFLLFSCLCTTYGYLVNDLGDRELDKSQGKANTFQDDSRAKATAIVCVFLLLGVASGMRFWESPLFLPFWLSWVFLGTAYSVRPLRLKERGSLGLVSIVLAQRVLPTLILFFAFRYYDWLDVTVLTAYVFFRGLSSDVNHQLEDYQKDSGTATDTYAVRAGIERTQTILRISLEMEKGLLLLCLLLMLLKLPHIKVFGVSLMLPFFLFGLLLYGVQWWIILRQRREVDVNPFVRGRKDVFQFLHHALPSVVLPLYLLVFLLFSNWSGVLILAAVVVLRRLYSLDVLLGSFPGRILRSLTGSR